MPSLEIWRYLQKCAALCFYPWTRFPWTSLNCVGSRCRGKVGIHFTVNAFFQIDNWSNTTFGRMSRQRQPTFYRTFHFPFSKGISLFTSFPSVFQIAGKSFHSLFGLGFPSSNFFLFLFLFLAFLPPLFRLFRHLKQTSWSSETWKNCFKKLYIISKGF